MENGNFLWNSTADFQPRCRAPFCTSRASRASRRAGGVACACNAGLVGEAFFWWLDELDFRL